VRFQGVVTAVCLAGLLVVACGPAPRTRVESDQDVEQAYARGTAALQAGRYGEAVPDLRLALRARSADLDVRYNLGVTLLRVHSWKDAAQVLGAADAPRVPKRDLGAGVRAPAASDADYLHALGSCYEEQHALPQALACFDAALARDARHLKSRYARGLVLEEKGDLPRARQAWRDYIDRDPSGIWSDSARRHLAAIDEQLRTSLRRPQ
jgi:tetratricopeptide (TPR) repeat protein